MELLRDISEELKSSYIDYAMSVIIGRALPDVRDGLKPVQRRILYAMYEMGLLSNRPYRKSARIVGEVLGKYHPHGDSAVYDALVRLAQDFSMRYPLVDGQGNFGSIDGDSAAAMRYTEARLAKIAEEMLADIEKNTVDFMPNFDATLQEPVVLPSKIPNLLINGSSGIAVGMATNIPPHNLSEVCDAIIAYLKKPDITVDELLKYIKGPDFPTGGIIVGREGIIEAYRTGRGKITVRGRVEIEKNTIIIKEVPYMVNKAKLVESIAELAREGKIDEIKTIRDESDREGIRVVIELKSGSNPDIVLKKLYAYSNLQTTFGIITLALVDKEPKILNLKDIISYYIDHRRTVVKRRVGYDLEKARDRLHIVEGLKVVVEDIDNAVNLIRRSKSPSEAKERLIEKYSLSSKQADAVLQMRLQKLTAIEIDALMDEYEELKSKIAEYESILADPRKIDEIISMETEEIKRRYGDDRRTEIILHSDVTDMDLIEDEENIVVITSEGFAKRMSLNEFRIQTRGGVGVIGTSLSENDEIYVFRICNSTDRLLLFTNTGRVFWIYAYEIPKMDRTAKGTTIKKFIRLENGEKVVSAIGVDKFDSRQVAILSPDGFIKKISLEEFENAKRAGIRASSGEISYAELIEGENIVITTSGGYVVRLRANSVPEYGRNAKGVIALRLREGDSIASLSTSDGEYLLLLTEKGYGKRCHIDEFRFIGRGSMGRIAYRISEKTGKLAFAEMCSGGEVFIMSGDGYCIRVNLRTIPIQGRYSSGVVVAKKGVKRVAIRSQEDKKQN